MTPQQPPRVRKSIALDPDEIAALEKLKEGDNVATEAFTELTGVRIGERTSEAEVLHTLLRLGTCMVRERELDIACQRAVEADARDPERISWRRAMSRHRHHLRRSGSASA